jgi:AGZA family xanthine/uracil permease-like MFS transporter
VFPGPHGLQGFGGFPNGLAALPIAPSGLTGSLDLHAAIALGAASVVFTFFFVDFFDATGTLVALAQRSGALDAAGNMPRARRTFVCDGLAAMIGALLGTSTTTAYIESASGIAEGGRSGLTACVVAVLFLLSTALWPLAGAIPACATAPALIVVGAMMMSSLRRIDWDDYTIAVPVFLTIIAMPLTFSIANGVSFGVIAYVAIKVLSGRPRDVDVLLYVVAALLLVRYIWLAG